MELLDPEVLHPNVVLFDVRVGSLRRGQNSRGQRFRKGHAARKLRDGNWARRGSRRKFSHRAIFRSLLFSHAHCLKKTEHAARGTDCGWRRPTPAPSDVRQAASRRQSPTDACEVDLAEVFEQRLDDKKRTMPELAADDQFEAAILAVSTLTPTRCVRVRQQTSILFLVSLSIVPIAS